MCGEEIHYCLVCGHHDRCVWNLADQLCSETPANKSLFISGQWILDFTQYYKTNQWMHESV